MTSIEESVFIGCTSLSNVSIGNGVTRIGNSAFMGCSSLNSILIPQSVNSIGEYAFSLCTNLTSITIPNSVTSIERFAFSYCSNLSRLTFLGDAPTLLGDPEWSTWPLQSGQSKTVYYFAGTTGWGTTFGGLTTVQLTTPAIQSLVFNVNGNAQISWSAMQGSVYEIQSTDSLDNPFVTRSIQTASNTVETWNEPDSSIPSKRFYRVNMRLP
jgi:hypothetical protein